MRLTRTIGKSKSQLWLAMRLHKSGKALLFHNMKFALAIAAFGLFAFFISWGVIMMMHGSPWLLIAAMGVFLGSFIKFGCLSH